MTIMVAYAHTPEGREAVRHGRELAHKDNLPLVIFDLDAASEEDDRSIAEPSDLGDLGPQVEARYMGRDKRNPDAEDEFLDAAEELDASLIVVGVRRRSPVGKFFLGSWAQQIIIDAAVPVLTVKAPIND